MERMQNAAHERKVPAARIKSWIEQIVALKPHQFPSTRGWVQAPACLRGVMQDSATLAGGGTDGTAISWHRLPYDGECGLLDLEGCVMLSQPDGTAINGVDPHARTVHLARSSGRPIYIAQSRAVFWNFRRNGGVRLFREGPVTEGTAILLGAFHPDCNNYFHFWLDAICDLWFAEQLGMTRDDINWFVMPFGDQRWQREILEICGIPLARVMPLSSFRSRRFARLVVPVRAKGSNSNPNWLFRAAREMASYVPPNTVGIEPKRIYVSRRDSKRRPLENETAVVQLLEANGFSTVTCAGLSVRQQQQLFAESSVIVAPHGAALTNLVWCRPGTHVIEILPAEWTNPCFVDLCRMGGLTHAFVPCRMVNPLDNPVTGRVVMTLDDLASAIEPISSASRL